MGLFSNLILARFSGFWGWAASKATKDGNQLKKSQRHKWNLGREVLLRRCREKAMSFRTGASRQDFGGAKLALGNDKVKGLASAQVALFQVLAGNREANDRLVFLSILGQPEPDAFGNVADTRINSIPMRLKRQQKEF
ncbi:hypothetical protein [uncultured Pontibacter sp.]|uniref:hypothetical protein n=1 Tax=uncultured Pontibacter sp. TaxID=453356 RepID=UPI00261FECEA|nr:hypothetical protein [uncultured Pontibacter sp.]